MKQKICLVLDKVARIVLGGLFVYAAWEKVQDPALFATMVAGYRFLPDVLVNVFALVLPMVELVAGVALIVTKWPRESSLVIFGMLCMFMVGLIQAAVRGLDISCGCFGDDKGGIGEAILRDVGLFVPAIWLLFRPNGWIWQFRMSGPAKLAAVAAALLLAGQALADAPTNAAPAAADAVPVVVEKWTRNFPEVLKLARANHVPVLMFEGQKGCIYCQRARTVFRSSAFGKWIVGTGIYMASAERTELKDHPEQKALADFLDAGPMYQGSKPAVPRIGVYWPREGTNGEVRLVFEAKRGKMPGGGKESLIEEITGSLEKLLADHFTGMKGRMSLSDTLSATAKQYKVACEGEGTVTMEPASGLLKDDDAPLFLSVVCPKNMEVQGWRSPEGKWVHHRPNQTRLKVTYAMPAGTYTAVVRERARFRRGSARPKKEPAP